MQFNPDGSLMATGCIDGTIKLWDAHSLQEIRVFYVNKKTYDKLKLKQRR